MKESQPFTYTRPLKRLSRAGPRRTKQATVTSTVNNVTYTPTCIYKNIINKKKFKRFEPDPPAHWPTNLKWPEDIMQALFYDMSDKPPQPKPRSKTSSGTVTRRTRSRSNSPNQEDTARIQKNILPCSNPSCLRRKLRSVRPDQLCDCTVAPWDERLNETWATQHIRLVYKNDKVGICALAKAPFKAGTVLGEYVGAIIPAVEENICRWNPYLYNISNQHHDVTLGYIDGLEKGSWTRFMNHSCHPNVTFAVRRVGREARMVCVVLEDVKKGAELCVDYGEQYWDVMRERGLFCRCGTEECEYSDESVVGSGESQSEGT